jgi:hypothetical protein
MEKKKGKITETTWGVTKGGIPYKETRKDGEIYISIGKRRL